MKRLSFLLGAALLAFTAVGEAHHALAATYQLSETQAVYGRVVQVTFREPHPLLQLEAVDRDGIMRRWSAEWDDTGLATQGITPAMLRVGDRVRIVGHPGRNAETYRLLIVEIERPADGLS